MTVPGPCYRLVVAGVLPATVVEIVDARFGPAASISAHGRDSAVDLIADQPALRALLTLLWDHGHDLLAIRTCAHRTAGALPVRSPGADADAQADPVGSRPTPQLIRRSPHHGEI